MKNVVVLSAISALSYSMCGWVPDVAWFTLLFIFNASKSYGL